MNKALISVITCIVLAACGNQSGVGNSDNISGPDEFSVLPVKPLQMPATNALPTPTPGAANLVDTDPNAQAIIALGGRPQPAGVGVAAGDVALVQAASRHGVDPDIRGQLVTTRRGGIGNLFGLLGRKSPFGADSAQRLNAGAELARLRAAGVDTPTAPPQ